MQTRVRSVVPAGPPPVLYSADEMKAIKLVELTEMFLPHVRAILWPKLKHSIDQMMSLILQGSPEIFDLVASVLDRSAPPARIMAMRACGIDIGIVSRKNHRRHIKLAATEAAEASAMALAKAWLDIFWVVPGEALVIDTDALDEAMMPPLDLIKQQLFEARCFNACLSVEEAKEVLRRVRDCLTVDPAFPDPACDFLEATLVSIRH